MRYLHTMLRITDIDASLDFFCGQLGLVEISRKESEKGRFTLIFLAAPSDVERAREEKSPMVELTWNWDPEELSGGRTFGHLAYRVENIYNTCQKLMDDGVTINRPPRDGHMAFVRSPDGHSIELLQEGESLPPKEPWTSMENTGSW
ncbi:MAG TPA: VOC family protein [Wenzhouxiangellaceae bacterium]|nr:VOC family protein [Wenzhouxiangellaceae bacterium]HKL53358.1 VOC family protein [Wenzhouxiangellaceae bacterium]